MNDVIRQVVNVASKTVRFGFEVLREGVALVADASDSTPKDDDAVSGAIRGGVLNYRTGMLDDGTDPVGWYEKD